MSNASERLQQLRLEEAGPGQESVWDYPRPPIVEKVGERLRVEFAGEIIADSSRGFRVLETSHPPVYYIHRDDILDGILQIAKGTSYCEYKGTAVYWNLAHNGHYIERAAWSYPDPNSGYTPIRYHLAFYASMVDSCWVGDEQAQAQAGDFYGGWITSKVVGPFKGDPGTQGW